MDRKTYPGYLDHQWRYRDADGHEVFCAEPYRDNTQPTLLNPSFEADLQFLREQGWRVEVDTEHARHNPGQTVSVRIWEKP